MLRQLLRRLRMAATGQVGGRGHEVKGDAADGPRNQGGRRRLAHAQGQVEALFHQVDDPAAQVDVERHFRKALAVGDQGARKDGVGEPDGGAQAQHAARHHRRAAHGRFHLVEVVEHVAALFEIHLADFRQAQVAAAAVQQARAQMALEVHHMLADHGRRQVEALAGAHEAVQFHHGAKYAHAAQGIHDGPIINKMEMIYQ